MHDGMQYDPSQGQGHEPSKVGNSTIGRCGLAMGQIPHSRERISSFVMDVCLLLLHLI